MKVNYILTVKEYWEASKLLWLRTTWARRFGYFSCYWVMPLLGIAGLAFGIFVLVTDKKAGIPDWLLVAAGAYFLAVPLLGMRGVRRKYRMQKLDHEWQVEINDTGIHLLRENGAIDARFQWSIVDRKYFETKRLFVVSHNRMSVIPIPKRVLEPAAVDELRALIDQHLQA